MPPGSTVENLLVIITSSLPIDTEKAKAHDGEASDPESKGAVRPHVSNESSVKCGCMLIPCRVFGEKAERMGERAQKFVDALNATAARYPAVPIICPFDRLV